MRRIIERVATHFATQREKAVQEEREAYERIRHYPHCTKGGSRYTPDFYLPSDPLTGGLKMYDTYCSECNKEEDRGNPRRTHTEFSNIEHSSQLPPEVVSGIVECVGSAFGSAPGDTAEHIKGDRIFLSQQEGKVVGFVSLGFASPSELFVLPASAENPQPESFSEQKGVYLAAATVSKEHQDTNIFRRLLEQSIDTALREERMMFSTRTQNPIVENAIHKVLQRYQRDKAISGYSLRRVLMKGCYGQMLTTEKPQLKNKKDDIQRAYDAIDQEAGDAYVLEFTLLPRKKGNR